MNKAEIIKPALLCFHLGLIAWLVAQGLLFALLRRRAPALRLALSGLLMRALLVGAEAAGYAYVRYIEPNWIAVERVTIRDEALAAALGGDLIVQISDLHIERIGLRERQLERLVNRQQADWIVVTGDLINGEGGWPAAVSLLRSLRARHGVWVVPGNTDNYVVPRDLFDGELRSNGIKVLRNQAAPMTPDDQGGAWLVGVDDPTERQDRLEQALAVLPASRPPVILLAHAPNILKYAERAGLPLVLAGHTHGGQIGIPWLRALSAYATGESRGPHIGGGLYRQGATQMYINRGIGWKALPWRLLCRPEITVFQFRGER